MSGLIWPPTGPYISLGKMHILGSFTSKDTKEGAAGKLVKMSATAVFNTL